MQTFDDLGLPFPLFRAPISHAAIDPPGACLICGQEAAVRFRRACYQCFRGGKVDHAIDTELGMVRRIDAAKGLTYGIPLGSPGQLADYDLVPHPVDPHFPDERWYSVRVASEYLVELIRTPKYHTWQGESWRFCCRRPCLFLGSLPELAFRAADKPLFEAMAAWLQAPDWDSIAKEKFGCSIYYVFQCPVCNSLRYHQDID
jgi:hypothetical protein